MIRWWGVEDRHDKGTPQHLPICSSFDRFWWGILKVTVGRTFRKWCQPSWTFTNPLLLFLTPLHLSWSGQRWGFLFMWDLRGQVACLNSKAFLSLEEGETVYPKTEFPICFLNLSGIHQNFFSPFSAIPLLSLQRCASPGSSGRPLLVFFWASKPISSSFFHWQVHQWKEHVCHLVVRVVTV